MRVYERPLDRGKPLWELHLFNGLAGGHSAILTKVHHCLADGVTGVELLSVTTSLTPDAPRRRLPMSTGSLRRCRVARNCSPRLSRRWRATSPITAAKPRGARSESDAL